MEKFFYSLCDARSSATTEQLLQQILHALEKPTMEYRDETHVHTRFWTSYKNEAKEYDDEFLRKRNGDLDIVLIFVSDCFFLTVTEL